ncbi:hypothetical protein FD19_GL001150 [Lacticaseibacillus thailandensis DSM 22698 = JCM 13996]|uniref:HD Cas3-type domain-containing protein n=1 Tax=Lacticaseibacillus thailandensis DSM 22698 = JCM 13996 TaxID=1423810 RepID=A0A0R2C7C7_9LACO|nr:hypothetical protein FD19_GL001150 [Lacticaseibacillus thailandensis DSM 22698 = JCM 13996]
MSDEEAQQLVQFVGFIHDFGKATTAFQTKESYVASPSLDAELVEQLEFAGFHDVTDANITARGRSPHALAGQALLERFGVPISVAAIIGAHHGKPCDTKEKSNIIEYTANYWQHDNDANQQKPWQDVQAELFAFALQRCGYDTVEDIPVVTEPQAVLLSGLLVMADWLASSEMLGNDPSRPLFPLIQLDQTIDDIDEDERANRAFNNWYVSDELEPHQVSLATDPYFERWGFHARPVQAAVTKAIADTVDPGAVIIEAPMGLGKTEIALLAAEQLAYKSGRNGLFFGLPTQATANAMFTRVEDWLNQVQPEDAGKISMHLMHGKAAFNPAFTSLPDAVAVDNDAEAARDDEAAVVNSWFSGKKTILDEVDVGTVDHLLLMALKQKHLMLRHLGLSKKVVIIDEIHAYDAYMSQYLARALEWLGAYHVPVVMLSATLPKQRRNALLAAYYRGKYHRNLLRLQDVAPQNWQKSEAYPLVTIMDGPRIHQVTEFASQSDQQPQLVDVQRFDGDDEALVESILNAIDAGGIAGVIVNTVSRAQTVAQLLAPHVPVITLHSAFLAPDRVKLEDTLQRSIGKDDQRPHKLVVVGTQVLEQSLDIDFDILYSDIAPIDLLLQRVGRLHRHVRTRPAGLIKPKLVVNYGKEDDDESEFGKANEGIYGRYLLMKTDYYLPDQLNIPGDISRLVQLVYDDEVDPEIDGLEEAKKQMDDNLLLERKKAHVFLLDKPKASKDLLGWLGHAATGTDTDEQKAQAAVRDIQPTLEVILLRRTEQGVGLLDGRLLSDCRDSQVAEQVIRLPHGVTYDVDKAIKNLELSTRSQFPEWADSKWLKGELAVVLDENYQASLGEYQLTYSRQYGLSYSKEEDHG